MKIIAQPIVKLYSQKYYNLEVKLKKITIQLEVLEKAIS